MDYFALRESSRAASIIGDLLEAVPQKGAGWFWRSVAGVVLSLAWRRTFGFAAAFWFGIYSAGAQETPIYGHHGLDFSHRPSHIWIPFVILLRGVCSLLAFATPYASFRYGVKDRFVRQIFVVWLLSNVFISFWWIPAVTVTSGAIGVAFFFHSIISARERKALSAFIVALGLSLVAALLSALTFHALFTWYIATDLDDTHWKLSVAAGSLVMWFAVLIQTSIYSRVHRLFFENKLRDGARAS